MQNQTTDNLEPEEGPSQPAQGFPFKSNHILRKQTRHKSDSLRDSKDGGPPSKRGTVKKEIDDSESSSSAGLSDETLHDHRFTVYGKDSAAVHDVRTKILGLEAGTKPSQQDIDSSHIFALRS